MVLLISIAWFVFAPKTGGYDHDQNWKPYGFIGVGLALILFFLSTFAVVETRSVGVEKFQASLGKT